MPPQQPGQAGPLSLEQMQDAGMNITANVCSIIAMPAEIILRPFYGTRYYAVPVNFLALVWMMCVTLVLSTVGGALQMIPLLHVPVPRGLFGIGSLAELFFLLFAAHSVRLWRRMIHMELEQFSDYEGPPLPFFRWLPKGDSFWFTRIVLEPAFVFVLATVLQNLLIFQANLAGYLRFMAMALAMKSFIGWYRSWEYLRKILDMRNAGPLMAKVIDNSASQQELSQLHIASFPQNIPADLRQAAASHIANAFVPDASTTTHPTQGASHAAD